MAEPGICGWKFDTEVNAIKAIEKDTMLEPEHIGHTEKKIG